MAKLPVHLDGGDFVVVPCSYAAMEEQRERFLRTGKGAGKFEYDCSPCQVRDCERRKIVDPTHESVEQVLGNAESDCVRCLVPYCDTRLDDTVGSPKQCPLAEQPLPVHTMRSESVTAALRALLDKREKKGIETYGVSLHTFNGRDAARDLVEELIDATQYALQWRLERAQLLARVAELEAEVAQYKSGEKV